MEFSAQLLVAAVVATAEFCASPIEGGVGEPDLCRLDGSREIATPFFSIVVEPEFLVGVDRGGRRMLLMPSYRQSQVHMQVEAVDDPAAPQWPDCPQVTESVEENVTWQDCRITLEGTHERRLLAKLQGRHVLIEYSYSTSGAVFAPALERMLQSVRILVN